MNSEQIEKLVAAANSTNALASEIGTRKLAEMGLDKNGKPISPAVKQDKPKAVTAKSPKPRAVKLKAEKQPQKQVAAAEEYDCDVLIEQVEKRRKKARERAAKLAAMPKKTQATKNKEAIEKAADRVEKNVEKRVKKGDVSVEEIKKLIAEYEDAIAKLKALLERAEGKMARGGDVSSEEVEHILNKARGVKKQHCGCGGEMARGGMTRAKREYNKSVDLYAYYIVDKLQNRAVEGYEFKSDAAEALAEYEEHAPNRYKVVAKSRLASMGIANPNEYFKSMQKGGRLVRHNGREYPTGSAWTKEHNERNKAEPWEQYAHGGDVSIANEILRQLGGAGRLKAMTGANTFVALPKGVSFRIKNQKANFIKITLTSMDLYDLEIGRFRGDTYKVVEKQEGLYNDMLKPAIEKATGMYLSLFAKGGTMESNEEDEYGTFEMYKRGGSVEVKIVNKDRKFDKSQYKWLVGDLDKDGVANADDHDPLNRRDKGTIDSPSLRTGLNTLLDLKKAMDKNMYAFVRKLKDAAPDDSKIYARTKTPYSIINKLISKRLLNPKTGLTDLVGTTIVVKTKSGLEEVKKQILAGKLGRVIEVEDMYDKPKDGYRAVHFLVEQNGMPVELQLKTARQKALNELSHEPYKLGQLDGEKLLRMSAIADKADGGDKKATAEYNEFMSQPQIERAFYREQAGKMAKGGGIAKKPSRREMLSYLDMYFEFYDELHTIADDEDNIITKDDVSSLDADELEMAYYDAKDAIRAETQFATGGGIQDEELSDEQLALARRNNRKLL